MFSSPLSVLFQHFLLERSLPKRSPSIRPFNKANWFSIVIPFWSARTSINSSMDSCVFCSAIRSHSRAFPIGHWTLPWRTWRTNSAERTWRSWPNQCYSPSNRTIKTKRNITQQQRHQWSRRNWAPKPSWKSKMPWTNFSTKINSLLTRESRTLVSARSVLMFSFDSDLPSESRVDLCVVFISFCLMHVGIKLNWEQVTIRNQMERHLHAQRRSYAVDDDPSVQRSRSDTSESPVRIHSLRSRTDRSSSPNHRDERATDQSDDFDRRVSPWNSSWRWPKANERELHSTESSGTRREIDNEREQLDDESTKWNEKNISRNNPFDSLGCNPGDTEHRYTRKRHACWNRFDRGHNRFGIVRIRSHLHRWRMIESFPLGQKTTDLGIDRTDSFWIRSDSSNDENRFDSHTCTGNDEYAVQYTHQYLVQTREEQLINDGWSKPGVHNQRTDNPVRLNVWRDSREVRFTFEYGILIDVSLVPVVLNVTRGCQELSMESDYHALFSSSG